MTITQKTEYSIDCKEFRDLLYQLEVCNSAGEPSNEENIIEFVNNWHSRAMIKAAPVPAMAMAQDERELFEEWAKRTHRRPGTHFNRSHSGVYLDNRIAAKWAAWQAATNYQSIWKGNVA